MTIEHDRVRFLAGVRLGRTLGSPIALLIENLDHANWRPSMQPEPAPGFVPTPIVVPRPGHADLAGVSKYSHTDIRDVLERSSARETVGRVAGGAVAKVLLRRVGAEVRGRVVQIGSVRSPRAGDVTDPSSVDWEAVEGSLFACDDPATEPEWRAMVDGARSSGESLGGVFEIWAWGLCPGIGGYATPADRLGGRLMGALGSIPAVKGVEVGLGFAGAGLPGSEVHDPILPSGPEPPHSSSPDPPTPGGGNHPCVTRSSNRAGGLEGGMTTGMPVVVRVAMKPIPTLMRPLPSVDLSTRKGVSAHRERSDVEAVAAARVVGEAEVALVLASAVLEKFGGDSIEQVLAAYEGYCRQLSERGLWCRS
jgi:chorismate synthase